MKTVLKLLIGLLLGMAVGYTVGSIVKKQTTTETELINTHENENC